MTTTPLVTLADRPELEAQIPRLHGVNWPAFIQADAAAVRYWGPLLQTFADYQYTVCDEGDHLIAAGHAIPLVWDGTLADLPTGWDDALARGFADYEQGRAPNTLCGLSIVIDQAIRGAGLSEKMVEMMKTLAQADGIQQIIIPVRPSLKSQHPEVPMDEYIHWQRPDGTVYDPWLRIHQRLGAVVIALAPLSMIITGSVADWETWTHQEFFVSGSYPVQGALSLITIDREHDIGLYEEPNVWVRYTLNEQA